MTRRGNRATWPPDPPPLPLPVVDNHTHLESIEPFVIRAQIPADAEAGGFSYLPATAPSVAEQLSRAAQVGVDRLVQCGCDLPSARWTDHLLREELASSLLGAIAIHPNEAVLHAGAHDEGPDGLAPRYAPHHEVPLDQAIAEIARIAQGNSRIRAIGETGIDTFRTGPRGVAAQRAAFRAHIALAKELDLALQIHDRDAHEPIIETLLADGAPERTVFHCFSGDRQLAEVCATNGWYLSFAGPVTYRSNEALRDALRVAPLALVLVETDAPYLTAHPFRGQPNAPYAMGHTVWAMAEIKMLPIEQLCAALSANSEAAYGSWAP